VPSVPPSVALHIPPQQSSGFAQISPFWMHHDTDSAQVPFVHAFEQHSPLEPHALPAVLQARLICAHFPSAHFPLQQAPLLVQASLSPTHLSLQVPLSHANEQQAVLEPHALPAWMQVFGVGRFVVHTCVIGSQRSQH